MIVLGVETSGPVGSLALRRHDRCLEERFLPELGRRHAQSLLLEVVSLLARHGLALPVVEAVAVSCGPGSFTGLRVGMTFAKTLAYATGAKVAAVETFRAIAENSPSSRSVAVVADAQRGGLIFARFVRRPDGSFERDGDHRLVPPENVRSHLGPGDLLTGPGVDRVPASPEIAPPRLRSPLASVVARLGEAAILRGEDADARTLEPLYVRKSGAEEKRDAADGADR